MSIITLILGLIIGFSAGMVVAAGGWRNALARLGAYATSAAKASSSPPPAVGQPIPTLPDEARKQS
jgi:hypothetical protein